MVLLVNINTRGAHMSDVFGLEGASVAPEGHTLELTDVIDPTQARDLADQLYAAYAAKQDATAAYNAAAKRIQEIGEEATRFTVDGVPVATWGWSNDTKVDRKRLKAEFGSAWAAVVTVAAKRSFRPVPKKK
jgi:hypothetical protein